MLASLLLALVIVILVARVVGSVFGRLRQPPVIGEVIAGVMLGPSVLGRVAPDVSSYVFPTVVLPFLDVLAQIGVILFMFLVGLELDTSLLRQRSRSVIGISVASMTTAFVLGVGLAPWLYSRVSTADVPFARFALFLGVAMSITAFPVLVRILTDRGLQRSEVGTVAISCAGVDDVVAWCFLAFISAPGGSQARGVWLPILLTAGYIALVLALVRPALRALLRRHERLGVPPHTSFSLLVLAMLASAWTTERIGIHALFGAFLIGAVVPHDSPVVREVGQQVQPFLVALFLPAFFALTGLRTQLHLVHGAELWAICLAITLVACLGKFGGTAVAARLAGFGWRQSLALGALMNTRGLMELIVLGVGLQQGVISATLFSMMVVMAVVTTLACAPILDSLTRKGALAEIPL